MAREGEKRMGSACTRCAMLLASCGACDIHRGNHVLPNLIQNENVPCYTRALALPSGQERDMKVMTSIGSDMTQAACDQLAAG